jgi:hypothetical protein
MASSKGGDQEDAVVVELNHNRRIELSLYLVVSLLDLYVFMEVILDFVLRGVEEEVAVTAEVG